MGFHLEGTWSSRDPFVKFHELLGGVPNWGVGCARVTSLNTLALASASAASLPLPGTCPGRCPPGSPPPSATSSPRPSPSLTLARRRRARARYRAFIGHGRAHPQKNEETPARRPTGAKRSSLAPSLAQFFHRQLAPQNQKTK